MFIRTQGTYYETKDASNACFNSSMGLVDNASKLKGYHFPSSYFMHQLSSLTTSCIIHHTSNNIAASFIDYVYTNYHYTFCHVVDCNGAEIEITADANYIHMQCGLGQKITSTGKGHTSQE